jgi:hypothetical protein
LRNDLFAQIGGGPMLLNISLRPPVRWVDCGMENTVSTPATEAFSRRRPLLLPVSVLLSIPMPEWAVQKPSKSV